MHTIWLGILRDFLEIEEVSLHSYVESASIPMANTVFVGARKQEVGSWGVTIVSSQSESTFFQVQAQTHMYCD